jgi:hypothetical protein
MTQVITRHDAVPRGGRRARDVLAMEQLEELRAMRQLLTVQAARTSGRMVNNIINIQTQVIPADGILPIDMRVAAGAIKATNLSAVNTVTIHGAPPQSYAPLSGIGVYVLLPNRSETIPVDSHMVTLYGTPNDRVSFVCFAAGPEPRS